jgi:hypothetical protein
MNLFKWFTQAFGIQQDANAVDRLTHFTPTESPTDPQKFDDLLDKQTGYGLTAEEKEKLQ